MRASREVGERVPIFDFSGGALCLDFVNTLGDRPHRRQERLAGWDDLLRWLEAARIVDDSGRARLGREAERHPRRVSAFLRRALERRERLYRIFAALATGRRPAGADLEGLNRDLARALRHLRVEPAGEAGFAWSLAMPGRELDELLWPVARSAGELLVSAEAGRVRECASDRCSWLFVDRSRGRRRRWCDMKVCGNRAKARRHYLRRKGEPGRG